ncbi:MAG TPA: hypothetical protein VHN80_00315 [Kineosporiaceae bacterium]|nr:hypothetical protein [Kineosporiaceae bacterium]
MHAEPCERVELLDDVHLISESPVWRAQGVRILTGRKSQYYSAAVDYFARAKRCYTQADRDGDWRDTVVQVQAEHRRKSSFKPRFQTLVNDADPEPEPSFLDRATSRWMPHDPG